jgi:hypothetical protein
MSGSCGEGGGSAAGSGVERGVRAFRCPVAASPLADLPSIGNAHTESGPSLPEGFHAAEGWSVIVVSLVALVNQLAERPDP